MPYFLGREPPPAPTTTTGRSAAARRTSTRSGSTRDHLTFFEMLGNFSFGDYFKDGAIEFAREFVRDHMELDWDRLWVTVLAGDPELGLGQDEVAIACGSGSACRPSGSCGCRRRRTSGRSAGRGRAGRTPRSTTTGARSTAAASPTACPGCARCERFLEFWNLVFMEYELHADGTLTPLPKQNIDTGLGLERAARILQDVPSIYDTDGYQLIMAVDRGGVRRRVRRLARPRRRRTGCSPTTAAR